MTARTGRPSAFPQLKDWLLTAQPGDWIEIEDDDHGREYPYVTPLIDRVRSATNYLCGSVTGARVARRKTKQGTVIVSRINVTGR